ncbi:hypothetical protein [Virgibacillus halodenitrificans]|uniref:hypothetical protein n=1 Tax=Virgibacillus halodenitrificans TaxID=1482 RepID=UPI000EF4C705|nr:hypothetical protein [Virgibacillus halodenitrificans]
MKKYVTELSKEQRVVYEYLIKNLNDDGSNIFDLLVEISEFYPSVSDKVLDAFEGLSSKEKIEVIHFATKNVMSK